MSALFTFRRHLFLQGHLTARQYSFQDLEDLEDDDIGPYLEAKTCHLLQDLLVVAVAFLNKNDFICLFIYLKTAVEKTENLDVKKFIKTDLFLY